MKATFRTLRRLNLVLWLRFMDWIGYQKEEIMISLNGPRWKRLVEEFDQYLRSESKYHDNEEAGKFREKLYELMNEENLNL